jgi:hypothetical protein
LSSTPPWSCWDSAASHRFSGVRHAGTDLSEARTWARHGVQRMAFAPVSTAGHVFRWLAATTSSWWQRLQQRAAYWRLKRVAPYVARRKLRIERVRLIRRVHAAEKIEPEIAR